MCLAVPGKITKIAGRKATVSYGSQSRQALVGEENVKTGDYVLVQMGIIIQVLTKKEADLHLKSFN
jgi:hydrogenase assembly chaperone HypC/HupF